MKTTRTVLLLLLSCFLLSSTCSKRKECPQLVMDNRTDNKIYYHYSYDYPDTSINFQGRRIEGPWFTAEAQQKTKTYQNAEGTCLEEFFSNYSIQKLSVFVFDAAVVDTTPWEKIRQDYKVLKRLDLSLDDLSNNNYVIELQ
jgi:hypothetical protein